MTRPAPAAPPSLWGMLWQVPLFQLAVYLLLAWGAWHLLLRERHLVISVLVAYLIAHLSQPLLLKLEKGGVARAVGIGLLALGLLALLAGILPLLGTIGKELDTLARHVPGWLDHLNTNLKRLAERYPALQGVQGQLEGWVKANASTLPGRLSETLGHLVSPRGAVLTGLLDAVGWLGRLFVTLIISIYMMAAYENIGSFLLRLLPERFQPLALEVSGHVGKAVGGYFRGQLTVALIMGAIIGVGLTVLGVPSALAIGFLAALLNIVPYLGVILSVIPALLMALPLGATKVGLVALLFLAANQLEGHVISPRVVSHSTNLSPLAVLLAILFGIELFGLPGAVIAVPTVATLKSLLDAYYYRSKTYQAR